MVDNQHELIKGYRDLTEEEILLINKVKDYEIELGGLWRTINGLDETDRRWAAVAKTHFEEGCSALVRSIAKPQSAFDF
jgi:hypothetical protein